MKCVYFGYDVFSSVLDDLVANGVQITRLYTLEQDDDWNKSDVVTSIAEKNGIEVHKGKPDKSELIEHCIAEGIDYGIVAATPYILPVDPRLKLLNFHPSYLPEGRGPWPIPAFLNGHEKAFGVAVHEVTEKVDHGPILLRKRLSVDENDCYETLVAKVQIGFSALLKEFLENPKSVWGDRQPQQSGTDIPFSTDEEQTIGVDDDVATARRKLRSFGRNEVSMSWNEQSWLIEWASTTQLQHNIKPGSVVSEFHGNVVIALCDGVIVVHSFRKEE